MRRFGVWQGLDAEGNPKLRPIDDARSSGHNAVTHMHETVTCISFSFAATVARCMASRLQAHDLDPSDDMPELRVGFDDMGAAYKRVPVRDPKYTVIAIWSVRRERVEYYYLDGHNFGLRSSVTNFCAFASLIVSVTRAFFAVPCGHYVDDFYLVDIGEAGESAHDALDGVMALFGNACEPRKRKRMAPVREGLGVVIDVSHVRSQGLVACAATQLRISKILDALHRARGDDCLPPGLASEIRGKIGFVLSSSHGRYLRAALQPLAQREHSDRSPYRFTSSLRSMLELLDTVLPSLPPLLLPIVRPDPKPLLVYSDAAYRPLKEPPWHKMTCAFVVIDPVSDRSYYAYSELDSSVFAALESSRNSKTLIEQGECIAAVAASISLPALFHGRYVLHHIDNTSALSALVHGYASKPDMARLVNAFHLMQFCLETNTWFEWVASAANVADLPSRLKLDALYEILPTVVQVPFRIPPFAEWVSPLAPIRDVALMFAMCAAQKI